MRNIRGAQALSNKKQNELGISDETLSSMKQFFLKTSVPRIIEQKRKEVKTNV